MRVPWLQTLLAVALAGLWGAAVYFAHAFGHARFLDRFEATLTDMRTLARGVQIPPDLATIVAIDDGMVKQGFNYPLPRAELANITRILSQFRPKVVAIDLLLIDRGTPEGDAALADALAMQPTVLAAAAVFAEDADHAAADDEASLSALPHAARFLYPLATFAERAEVGIVNVATNQSGTPLAIPMLFRSGKRIELSLPLRVAALALGQPLVIAPDRLVLGGKAIPTDFAYALPLSYYGPRRTIRTVSAASVLDGTLQRDAVQDRIVVIGATVTGAGDFFPTPFDSLMPGVEIIATSITHLVADDGMIRDRRVHIIEGAVAVLLPMLLVALLAWRRSALGIAASSALAGAWMIVNVVAFTHGVWLEAATTIAAAAPPVVLFGAFQIWAGARRAEYYLGRSQMLEPFQAPALQQWLARDPHFLERPVRQNAAVVFIDLSGFTSLSEGLDPDTCAVSSSSFTPWSIPRLWAAAASSRAFSAMGR